MISERIKGFKIFLKGLEDFEGQESLVNSLLKYSISLKYSRLYDCKLIIFLVSNLFWVK